MKDVGNFVTKLTRQYDKNPTIEVEGHQFTQLLLKYLVELIMEKFQLFYLSDNAEWSLNK